jgi:hypothetical protein
MKAKLHQSNLQHGWLIDSGALWTICLHHSWFTQFSPLLKHTKVILSDDSAISARGTGCIKVWMFANGKWAKSILQDVLYVLDLYSNLLLVSHLTWCGTEVCFLSENCHMYNKHKSLVLEGRLCNDLYVIRMQINSPITAKLAILDMHLKDAS